MSNIKPINTEKNGRDNKGRFKNGNIGKPKGATNKTTKDIKEFITNFLNDKAYEIPHIWDALDDKEKATLYLHLAKLVLPKATDEENEKTLNFINLGSGTDPNKILTPEEAREQAKRLDEEY